jgi:hypothetical protein
MNPSLESIMNGTGAPEDSDEASFVVKMGIKKSLKEKSGSSGLADSPKRRVKWQQQSLPRPGGDFNGGGETSTENSDDKDDSSGEGAVLHVPLPNSPNGALLNMLDEMNKARETVATGVAPPPPPSSSSSSQFSSSSAKSPQRVPGSSSYEASEQSMVVMAGVMGVPLRAVGSDMPHTCITHTEMRRFWATRLSPRESIRFPLFLRNLKDYLHSSEGGSHSTSTINALFAVTNPHFENNADDNTNTNTNNPSLIPRCNPGLESRLRMAIDLDRSGGAVTALKLDRALQSIKPSLPLFDTLQMVSSLKSLALLPSSDTVAVPLVDAAAAEMQKLAGKVMVVEGTGLADVRSALDLPGWTIVSGPSATGKTESLLFACHSVLAESSTETTLEAPVSWRSKPIPVEKTNNKNSSSDSDSDSDSGASNNSEYESDEDGYDRYYSEGTSLVPRTPSWLYKDPTSRARDVIWIDCRGATSRFGLLSRLTSELGLRGVCTEEMETHIIKFITGLAPASVIVLDHVSIEASKVFGSLLGDFALSSPEYQELRSDTKRSSTVYDSRSGGALSFVIAGADGDDLEEALGRPARRIEIPLLSRSAGEHVARRVFTEMGGDTTLVSSIVDCACSDRKAAAAGIFERLARLSKTQISAVTQASILTESSSNAVLMRSLTWEAMGPNERKLARALAPLQHIPNPSNISSEGESYYSPPFDLGFALHLTMGPDAFGDLADLPAVLPASVSNIEGPQLPTFSALIEFLHPLNVLAGQDGGDTDDEKEDDVKNKSVDQGEKRRSLLVAFARSWRKLQEVGWLYRFRCGTRPSVSASLTDRYFLPYRHEDCEVDNQYDIAKPIIVKVEDVIPTTPNKQTPQTDTISQKQWNKYYLYLADLLSRIDQVLLHDGDNWTRLDGQLDALQNNTGGVGARAVGFDVSRWGCKRTALDLLDRNKIHFDRLLGSLAETGIGKKGTKKGSKAGGEALNPEPLTPGPGATPPPPSSSGGGTIIAPNPSDMGPLALVLSGRCSAVLGMRYTANQALPINKGLFEVLKGNCSWVPTSFSEARLSLSQISAVNDYGASLMRVGRLARAKNF